MGNVPYLNSPDILAAPGYTAIPVQLDYEDEAVMLAGSPIGEEGKITNDGTAIGLLLRDCYKGYHRVGRVVVIGRINTDAAESNSGITLDPLAKANMKNLTFVGSEAVQPSGGGDFIISGTYAETDTSIIIKDLDKTFEESMQAFREGGSVKVKVDAGILLTFANAYSLGTSGVVALMFKLQIAPTVIVDGTWRETASDIVFALPS